MIWTTTRSAIAWFLVTMAICIVFVRNSNNNDVFIILSSLEKHSGESRTAGTTSLKTSNNLSTSTTTTKKPHDGGASSQKDRISETEAATRSSLDWWEAVDDSKDLIIPRYSGPPVQDLTEEQTEVRNAILASRPGTGLKGPFGPWLSVPDICQPAQSLGHACRYGTSLARRESELVILMVGAKARCATEFAIHVGEAVKGGLDMSVIRAIPVPSDEGDGENDILSFASAVQEKVIPLLDTPREKAIARFAAELLETSSVSDATYESTKSAVDGQDQVLVEITSIVGYYNFVSLTLNVFRIPS